MPTIAGSQPPGPEAMPSTATQEPPSPSAPKSSPWLFGESFLREVVRWSIGVVVLGGVVVWFLTAEVAFTVGLWIGAAVDIATFRYLAIHGYESLQDDGSHGLSAGVLLIRFTAKGLLLVLAAVLASNAAFWGVFVGVLVVEFMLVVVGMVRSATDVFHSRSKPGQGVQP